MILPGSLIAEELHAFVDALRAVLGKDPLYQLGRERTNTERFGHTKGSLPLSEVRSYEREFSGAFLTREEFRQLSVQKSRAARR